MSIPSPSIRALIRTDLDGCRDPQTGALAQWAIEILGDTRSYTEISPSGTGPHIFIRGMRRTGGHRYQRVETYDSARYFTMTGLLLGQLLEEDIHEGPRPPRA
jgi:primase-polymerase (primpol)-like protein